MFLAMLLLAALGLVPTKATTLPPLLLTVAQASALLGVSPNTVYRWIEDRTLPSELVLRIGAGLRIKRPLLEAWAASPERRR